MFPIHLNIGFKIFYNYEGIYFAIAIIIGYVMARKKTQKNGYEPETIDSLLFYSILGALIGGRLFSFFFWGFDSFLENPLSFFAFWNGGISITGGIAGGVVTAIIFSHIKKIQFFNMYSLIAPIFLISQAIGRIGCFLNGDAHGTYSTLPWAVRYPRYGLSVPSFEKIKTVSSIPWEWSVRNGLVDRMSEVSAPLHPTQLYEAMGDIVLVVLIFFLNKMIIRKEGSFKPIFLLHIGGYSLLRFFIEFIRADRANVVFLGVSMLQIMLLFTAVGCFISGTVFYFWKSDHSIK